MLLALVLTAAWGGTTQAQPYYARGDFYAGSVGTWGYETGNQLFDDGLHGDGAAGDGIYAGDVTSDQAPGILEWKIANADWTQNWPSDPVHPMVNARLFTSVADEIIHFRLDLNPRPGWQPLTGAVACDHPTPPGIELELCGGDPETGSWTTGVPAVLVDGVWTTMVHVATAGTHEFKFRGVGSWDWPFGIWYNMYTGHNFSYTTTVPGTAVRFEFDTRDGRGRAIEYDETPVYLPSWGRLKSLYR
jgi:hypothetical protein